MLSLRGKVHGFPLALVDEYKDSCCFLVCYQAASKLQA